MLFISQTDGGLEAREHHINSCVLVKYVRGPSSRPDVYVSYMRILAFPVMACYIRILVNPFGLRDTYHISTEGYLPSDKTCKDSLLWPFEDCECDILCGDKNSIKSENRSGAVYLSFVQ